MFSRICRSDDAKTVWRVLLICVNSLQVINIEILPTLPINHLIKLSCATILQWFWDFTAVVPLFRKKNPANISWLYFGWADAQEESWHAVCVICRLQIFYYLFSSLIYTEGNKTRAGFCVVGWFFLLVFFFGSFYIGKILHFEGCKQV